MSETTDAETEHETYAHDDVELIATADLIPYHNNPKEHPDEQIDKIASSIKHYGFDQPIVVDGDNEIIKGHGRHKAAKKLGLDTVPVITRTGLSDAQVKAARIADNKTQMESGWNTDSLAGELELLKNDTQLPADATGFNDIEVEGLLESNDIDVDQFFEDDGMDNTDDAPDDAGPPPGEFACPECGHTFAPDPEEMGGE